MSPTSAPLDRFLQGVNRVFPKDEAALITQALALAKRAHRGQKRGTGEPYVEHSVAVAEILLEWGLDGVAIAAALLHDVPEDTRTPISEIREQFGDEVTDLVEAVTKLSAVRLPEEDVAFEVENLRRLFLAMARDLRVVLLKLADRLHNMRTIKGVTPAKRRRIGKETLEIYAPLADRLGMGEVRSELDDLAFKAADPEEYAWTKRLVDAEYKRSQRYMAKVKHEFVTLLAEAGIKADINTRTKNLWSLHKKLLQKERDIDRIYDFFAVRVIVDSVATCYQGMGVIHQRWQPLPHRIKDYIAVPKQNGYRSLHTTIFGPEKRLLEVQIRTEQMHREAEWGVAAHVVYAENKEARSASHEQLKVMEQLASWQDDLAEAPEMIDRFKLDLFVDRIFAFTPKGAPFSLPTGATPVDFAFHVHTEVGERCTGAKVNGVIVPLDAPLANGDVVEILTSQNAHPRRDWLNFVRTGHARSHIRSYFRQQDRAANLTAGQQMVDEVLKKHQHKQKLSKAEQAGLAKALGVSSFDDALARLGEGGMTRPALEKALDLAETPSPAKAATRPVPRPLGIALSGMASLMTKPAKCCNPHPPQPIVGYITLGKGISIHRQSCPQVKKLPDPLRLVTVSWER